jgi:methylenetetrahydrofolate--tRNA-(uracil-5-)-methyltransferase
MYEMRPTKMTPAHASANLAELVCSNSLGSNLVDRASGLLKEELRRLGSLVLACADATALPAGGALAVDRDAFSLRVTESIAGHPRILLRREEIETIPEGKPVVIATGPLTSAALAEAIAAVTGSEHLFFYDAMAPIVASESVDRRVAFRANRYGRSGDCTPSPEQEGDYLNCPMTREEYERFVHELLAAQTNPLRGFEREDARFFEACLPVEELARRGQMALAFGPLKPVGLVDPRTGRRPFAVVQLRQDNQAGTLYNLVGFQTNLRWSEQGRVFRLIPGLEQAEFVRYGQMHRNTFIHSPSLLRSTLQFRSRDDLFFAGQLTGTEGYVGSVASGLVAGLNASMHALGKEPVALPTTTMVGALCHYVSEARVQHFQPMKANYGLMPPLEPPVSSKGERNKAYSRRALDDLARFVDEWRLARDRTSGLPCA